MLGKRKKKSAAASGSGVAGQAKQKGGGARKEPPVRLPVRLPVQHDMCSISCPKLLLDGTPRNGFICRDFGPLRTHEDGGPVKSGRCKED